MTKGSQEKLLYCSFCGKSQHEVKKLIAGPSVFICDECIDLCNDIIREEVPADAAPGDSKGDLPTPSEIKANLAVGRCAIEAHSGAEINVKGVAEECKINAMSGATCKARNLLTRRTEARASSGASVRITCSETLEAAASSGGSVSYWGDCRLVGFKKNLTGSVTHKR